MNAANPATVKPAYRSELADDFSVTQPPANSAAEMRIGLMAQ